VALVKILLLILHFVLHVVDSNILCLCVSAGQDFVKKLTSKIRTQLGWNDVGDHSTRLLELQITSYYLYHIFILGI